MEPSACEGDMIDVDEKSRIRASDRAHRRRPRARSPMEEVEPIETDDAAANVMRVPSPELLGIIIEALTVLQDRCTARVLRHEGDRVRSIHWRSLVMDDPSIFGLRCLNKLGERVHSIYNVESLSMCSHEVAKYLPHIRCSRVSELALMAVKSSSLRCTSVYFSNSSPRAAHAPPPRHQRSEDHL